MKKDEKRFIKLGWTILEAKYFYYVEPDSKHNKLDSWYDMLEDAYKALAKKLDRTPTASNHVGFPKTPSGMMVRDQCMRDNFKYTIDK